VGTDCKTQTQSSSLSGNSASRISLARTTRFEDGQARRKSGRFLGVRSGLGVGPQHFGCCFCLMITFLRVDADLRNFNSLTTDP
jgi:hypothetical protein